MFLTFNKYYFCEKEVSKIKSISKKFLLYFTQFTLFYFILLNLLYKLLFISIFI